VGETMLVQGGCGAEGLQANHVWLAGVLSWTVWTQHVVHSVTLPAHGTPKASKPM
jgi:hypothetical protein